MSKILGFSAKGKKPFEIRSKSATSAEIVIYDQIGYDYWSGGGVTAKSFSEELKSIDSSVKNLDVRINSPGGDVFDGIAIYNRLKQFSAKKTVYIDGLAASIASIIALAGDEIVMGEGALYMVHLPWTMAMGNRMELDNTVQRLMDVEEQMISIYQARTKMGRDEIRKMLEDETWMDSDQAMDCGFVDKKMTDTAAIAASVFNKSSWIARPPKNYKSESGVVKKEVENLKQKIAARLARS